MPIMGVGNPEASIMLVGESFTQEDARLRQAFMGRTGEILNQLLRESNIFRSECYATCVFNDFPDKGYLDHYVHRNRKVRQPDDIWIRNFPCHQSLNDSVHRLFREIGLVKPKVIVALGEIPMWVLTGAQGIDKWRGSILEAKSLTNESLPIVVIPTLPLSRLYHAPEHKAIMVHDLKRAKSWSLKEWPPTLPGQDWAIQTRPMFEDVKETLYFLQTQVEVNSEGFWIDFDLETRAGHIACAGISWSDNDAICIPFMCVESFEGYWTIEEETEIVFDLYQLLTHPNVRVRGQNLLYDCQYTMRWWKWVPRVAQDTMISHHTCFAGLSKSLAFQASLYCDDYVYWKDDGKTWTKEVGEDQLWRYNGIDCLRTRQVGEVSQKSLGEEDLLEVDRFQQELFWPVLYAMCRGTKINLKVKKNLVKDLKESIKTREDWIVDVVGHPFNIKSPKQMTSLFYEDLKCQKVLQKKGARKGVGVTCDDDALKIIAKREPLVKPLTDVIQELRSLGVFCSTFASAEVDHDERMRSSFNICGTDTYRLSSSKNAFGSGLNFQNIPSGGSAGSITLPNIRKLFIPDDGMIMFDMDLDRADLQIVAWEADEPALKEALRRGVDMHLMNAMALIDRDVDLNDLIEGTESCARYKHDFAKERKLAKIFCHAVDYGAQSRTLSIQCGISIVQAEKCRNLYLGKFPGIGKWQERVIKELQETHSVKNIFGYRKHFFGDVSTAVPEALAWQPQSTVANVIDKAWVNIWNNLPEVEILIQVHDSLVGQFPANRINELLDAIKEQSKIVVPYDDPLVIPVGFKLSTVSWGDAE